MPNLKTTLDKVYRDRSAEHLANDPLSFCHRFQAPEDQEVAGLIASCFAYGNVKIIKRNLQDIFSEMGSSPRHYVERFDPAKGKRTFSGFKHRFNDGRDLCGLLLAAQIMVREAGTIQGWLLRFHDEAQEDVTETLSGFSASMKELDLGAVFGRGGVPADSYFPFFFPSPASGSACKRLCMYLRWMVRPADGIDLGIWTGIAPSRLVIPVDAHIQRICTFLGLTTRKQADWRMAREITTRLRELDPEDPVKYDFPICHLGISEGCDGKNRATCRNCAITGLCAQGKK
ncbi:TIGR02757 family protein [Geomesophilobacter sediminis]|uniref:TIGR02757 family protein n=1 Tax=Geomesophilobacter sediminis TaxID=2798584 RepID=A0A8J7M1L4_9BACT|nr:TIGR02757 family protein [Geomesophilobacter sediminis]MBJ6726977.1 TIGR02757 family protein [Geomesophilobacter sediminis]